jgi:predicted ATPase
MKYIIRKYQYCTKLFVENAKMKSLCEMADLIEISYPESVVEVIYNRLINQGCVILKSGDNLCEGIKKLIENHE